MNDVIFVLVRSYRSTGTARADWINRSNRSYLIPVLSYILCLILHLLSYLIPGPTGPWGPTGAIGGTGPAGPNGADGIPGVPGSAGAAGAAGPPGVSGSSGVPGVPGAAGAAGASGGGGGSSSSSSGGAGGGGGGGRSLDFYLFGDGPVGPPAVDLGHFLDAEEQEETETGRKASRMDPFYKAGRYLGRIVGDRFRFYSSQIPISAPPGMNLIKCDTETLSQFFF